MIRFQDLLRCQDKIPRFVKILRFDKMQGFYKILKFDKDRKSQAQKN